MRRLFRWIAGLVSVAALAKLLSGRRHRHDATSAAPASPTEPDPAEELRRKLAEVRASAPADEAQSGIEPAAGADVDATDTGAATGDVPADDAPALSLEERRAAIHARAQEAIDAMKEIEP